MSTGRRKKSGFAGAILLGLIFGIFLVVCQELIYQSRLMAQYEKHNEPDSGQYLSSQLWMPEETLEPEEPEAPGEVQTGPPIGYQYSEDSGETTIQIGDDSITVNFEALKVVNPDFVGWLVVPGTDISYPVVQGSDNFRYLDHIFDGSYSKVGTLFADYRNVMLEDENTIIYGHNFHQYGSMFSQLVYYAGQEYYDEHPLAYFLTENGGYVIEIFGAYEAQTSDDIYILTYSTDKAYEGLITHVNSVSNIKTNVAVSSDDKIMTLSTCSNESYENRFVVIGKIAAFRE